MSRLLLVLLATGLSTSTAFAQFPGQRIGRPPALSIKRPTTSPYLFLGGNGSRSAAFNYFRRIQPEQNFRQFNRDQARVNQQLSRNVSALQNAATQPIRSQLTGTGHTTSFLSYGGYFPGAR